MAKGWFLKSLMFNVFLQIVVNHYFRMKIAIKILSHLIKNWTEDPLVARNEISSSYYYYYSFFLHKFCAEDFSEMVGWICFKFSGMLQDNLKFIPAEGFCENHFRSRVIALLSKFRGPPCPFIFSKTAWARAVKFSVMIEDMSPCYWEFG